MYQKIRLVIMNACVLIPTIKVNNKEKESKLFKDLEKMFADRKDAIEIWSLAQVPGFMAKYNLEKVDGEYLAEDIKKALSFDEVLEDRLSINTIKKDNNFIDENNNPKVFTDFNDATKEAETFNEKSKNFNADIVKPNDKGWSIDVGSKITTANVPEKIKFNSTLNNKLLNLLNEWGFDVEIIKGLQQDGIFDPLNSERNANGLISIIKLAQGIRGEEALPEEFSHLLIAGLRNQPLVRRALESLTDQQIQTVLGNQYEEYKNTYNEQYLKEEALGRMLADSLINKQNELETTEAQNGLLKRLWDFIKNIFKNVNKNEIDTAISEAKKAADEIATQVLDGDLPLIDKNDILNSETMYHLGEAKKSIEKLAEESRNIVALLMKDKSVKLTSGVYSPEDKADLAKIDAAIEEKRYVDSCCDFLESALANITEFRKTMSGLEGTLTGNGGNLRVLSQTLVNLKNYSATYSSVVAEMATLDESYEDLGISKEDGERIAEEAQKVMKILNKVKRSANKLTFDFAKAFLAPYWKDKKIDTKATRANKKLMEDQVVTLDILLTRGFNDITFADRLVNSIVECSDILLALMAKIAIQQQDKRDNQLIKDDAYIRDCEQKLRAAGYTSDFMFEKDSNGIPTGYIISDRNTAKFTKDKQNYIDELQKDNTLSVGEKLIRLQKWESKHTTVIYREFNGIEIPITVPSNEYLYSERESPLNKLSAAQKEYYESMMNLKAAREMLIPEYQRNLYKAVQIRTDFIEELANNITNPKELWNKILEKAKDNFVKRCDDTEFGSLTTEGEKLILLNAQGKPVKNIPVFYLSDLEDMSQLSTDFGAAIRAHSASLLNYAMMNDILPQMELLNDIVQNREVTMTSGDDALVSIKKIFGKEIQQDYTKQGKELRVGKASEFLMDKMFYGINKKEGKQIQIGKAKVDSEKLLDSIKSYTSIIGMGLNLYSGISNLTMGGVQMIIEARAKENFGFKDLSKAHLDYDKDLLGCIAEINSIKRENKLSLLMDKFDSLESFYDELKRKGFYKNGVLRGISNTSMMILNEIGEHRLHNVTMLAMLEHEKLKKPDGTEISLYDALEVSKEIIKPDGTKEKVPAYIKIKDGVTKADGTEFTQDDFVAMKRKISRVNRRLHGAYSETFKGQIHQKAWGRMVMQFRQWMPGFYSNRFAGLFGGNYYDVELGDVEEGYYVTTFKFIASLAKDIKKARFDIATRKKMLTPHERANIRRFFMEVELLAVLSILCGAMGALKDDKDHWSTRMLYYQMLRLKLEVGAGVPFNINFADNIWTILQSPAASIKTCNNLLDLLCFWNLFTEIQSGRYQGHSRYFKDFVEAIPLYGQIRKAIDIKEEDYMFNIVE